jgi:hypothetical protein
MVKRTIKLTIGLALIALVVLPAAVLTQGVVGRVLNRRTRAVFPTLTAALAAALPGDTLLLAGNIAEPGPVSLAGWSGVIIGETRIGFRPTISQTATGACPSGPSCIIDASGRIGTVQIIGVNFRTDSTVAILSFDTGFALTLRNNGFAGVTPADDVGGIIIADFGGPYRIENNTVTCGSALCIGIGVVGLTLPPAPAPITSLSILGNRINDLIAGGFTLGIGLADVAGGPITIERNTIDGTGASTGVGLGLSDLIFGVGVERATVRRNTVRNFTAGGLGFGMVLINVDGSQVTLNRLQNNFAAMLVDIDFGPAPSVPNSYDEGILPAFLIRDNNIIGTPTTQAGIVYCDGDCTGVALNGNTLLAFGNYWGAASGPSSATATPNSCPEATGVTCGTLQAGATDGTGMPVVTLGIAPPECGTGPSQVTTCPHRAIAVFGAGSGG